MAESLRWSRKGRIQSLWIAGKPFSFENPFPRRGGAQATAVAQRRGGLGSTPLKSLVVKGDDDFIARGAGTRHQNASELPSSMRGCWATRPSRVVGGRARAGFQRLPTTQTAAAGCHLPLLV